MRTRIILSLVLLTALPLGDTTEIGPVDAPTGTVITICVGVLVVTLACLPPTATTFCVGTLLKPEPLIVTLAPAKPLFGLKPDIVTTEAVERVIESRLPTAS